ncbi:MAG: hypothetical protein QM731_23520 [Chitinophagaceae bacterium]
MSLRKSLLAALLFLGCIACQKEVSLETGSITTSSQWEFKEASSQFKGTIDTAYFDDVFGIPSLILDGTSDDLKGELVIQLFGTSITTGTYKTPMVFFDYYQGGKDIYSNDISAIDKFTLTITKLDSTSVTGTFTGQVLDTLGAIKTITDGKFTAYFKKATTTPGGGTTTSNCRVSNIAYYDISSNSALAAITSYYNSSNQVNKIQLIDSTTLSVDQEYNLTYPSGRINLDSKQYFTLNSDGKIKEFHGYLEPTDNTMPEVVMAYTYNSSGYLTQSTIALATLPTLPVITSTYAWTSGNLTSVTSTVTGTPEKTVVKYEYDAAVAAKDFVSIFPSSELIIFQSAIDCGKAPANLVKKVTIENYNASGTLTSTSTSNFASFTFDTNGRVKTFNITGDGSIYSSDVKYALSYKCK